MAYTCVVFRDGVCDWLLVDRERTRAAAAAAGKTCASCSVNKTPLWRDAEDGTPLCNACGIRYVPSTHLHVPSHNNIVIVGLVSTDHLNIAQSLTFLSYLK